MKCQYTTVQLFTTQKQTKTNREESLHYEYCCPHGINQIIGKNIWMQIHGGKKENGKGLDGLQLEQPQYV